jgi:Lon protease-like protein
VTADVLPLFPLNTVLYPGVPLPLHVFEYRYRTLFDELAESAGPRRVGVVAIRRGLEVGEDERPVLHEVGCVAEIRRAERYADGRYDVVTMGGPRFRLLEVDDARPYLRGTVAYLTEETGEDAEHWAALTLEAFAAYCGAVGAARDEEIAVPDLPADDPALVSYVVAAAVRLDLPEKQELLAIDGTTARLRRELSLLRRETALVHAAPAEVPTEGPFSLN